MDKRHKLPDSRQGKVVSIKGNTERSLKGRLLARREFLKGVASLGILAFLSSLMPSCLRGNRQAPEAVLPINPSVSSVPDESDLPVPGGAENLVREESGFAQDRTPLAILYRPELEEYNFGLRHSYMGVRYRKFIQFLQEKLPEDNNYRILGAEPATDEDLLLICQKEYINFTKEYFKATNLGLERPEGFSKFHSLDNMPNEYPGKVEEAARLIVGQAKAACDLVQEGKFKKAVSIGGGMHHAKPAYGEGFCIYNDVAFCGLYLMQQYKLERILILDTDAHTGNGTSEYFYDDPRLLLIDLHQDPTDFYPCTGFGHQIGSGKGKGFTINIPLPTGAGDDCYKLAFESIVEPVTREFKPQIIVRNGGSDPHYTDRLANLELRVKGFRMIGEKVREMANVCDGKVIDLIASGYNRKVLPYVWLAMIVGLGGIELGEEELRPFPHRAVVDPSAETKCVTEELVFAKTGSVIEEVKSQLKDYWSCLK